VISVGAFLKQSSLQTMVGSRSQRTSKLRRAGRLSVVLGSVLGALLLSGTPAHADTLPIAAMTPEASVELANAVHAIEDGLYFYGQATAPDEIGATYLVFAAQGGDVVGAVFMPHSSFDCFQGSVQGNALALQITHSYTQEVHDYAIALASTDTPVAATRDTALPFRLEGFHHLGAPGDNELSMLATCQSDLWPSAEMEL